MSTKEKTEEVVESKTKKTTKKATKEVDISEEPKKETKKTPSPEILAVVTNCLALNLRKKPVMDAPVVEILSANEEVFVLTSNPDANEEWYAVRVARDGNVGYCKSAYIELVKKNGKHS